MDNELSRRKLVALGTAGGAALLGATVAQAGAAAAAPGGPGQPHPLVRTMSPDSDPGGPRIGSAPIGGYSYLHLCEVDFLPGDLVPRTYTSTGVFGGPSSLMQVSAEIPAGAVLRDVEWYASAQVNGDLSVYLWNSGTGNVSVITQSVMPPGPIGVRALRAVVPDNKSGPFGIGAKLILSAAANSPNFTINGARLGFTAAPAGTVLLPAPVRVYDSRSGAKIGNGQTRIHSLASRIPARAVGAILNLSITSGEKSGGLAAYNTGSSLPSGSTLYWNGSTTVSNEIHVKLPSDRKIKVTSRGATGCKAHYFIDLVGYTA